MEAGFSARVTRMKRRRCRKRGQPTATKRCPTCAKDYNANMGTCDQCNSLRASYSLQLTHHRRWYMCLVYYGLDLRLISSYIWFKDITGTNMSQKNYRVSVIDALIARQANMGGRNQFITKRKRTSDTRPINRQYPMRVLDVAATFHRWWPSACTVNCATLTTSRRGEPRLTAPSATSPSASSKTGTASWTGTLWSSLRWQRRS